MLEINAVRKFLLFRMKYNIDRGFHLIIDTCNYFIIPMRK